MLDYVDVTTTLTIAFSEHVDITASGVTLECPASTPIAFSGLPLADESNVTLTPNAALPEGVICVGTVLAAEVTDTDGTPDNMAADFSFSFTTVDLPDEFATVRDLVDDAWVRALAGRTTAEAALQSALDLLSSSLSEAFDLDAAESALADAENLVATGGPPDQAEFGVLDLFMKRSRALFDAGVLILGGGS